VRGNFSPSKGYSLQNSPFEKGGQGDLKSPLAPLYERWGVPSPLWGEGVLTRRIMSVV